MVLVTILCLSSCQARFSREQERKNIDDATILIFNCQGNELLQNFKNAYPDIDIEVKTVSGSMEDEIQRYGEPDIVLFGGLIEN